MGTWPGLRAAFIIGLLFVSLLIFLYWDDVRTIGLFRFRVAKDKPLEMAPASQTVSAFTSSSNTPVPPKEAADEDMRSKGQTRRAPAEDISQERRRQRVMDVCSGRNPVQFPGRTRTFEQIPFKDLDHLIVDDTHRIIYCFVPKVACTNWKRVMVVLSEVLKSPSTGKPYTDPEAIPSAVAHSALLQLTFAKYWQNYGSLARHLMALKLQNYTKFLFVRDPFERLISAFRNKFGRPNEDFYKQFGSVMLRRYGNVSGSLAETAAQAFAAGVKPTFHQFITYLLDPETEKENPFNEHWRQVKYDFIGKLETLEADSNRLLKLLKLDQLLRFPRNHTVLSRDGDWFAQIPVAERRELYKLYEADFQLFGYPEPLHLQRAAPERTPAG